MKMESGTGSLIKRHLCVLYKAIFKIAIKCIALYCINKSRGPLIFNIAPSINKFNTNRCAFVVFVKALTIFIVNGNSSRET